MLSSQELRAFSGDELVLVENWSYFQEICNNVDYPKVINSIYTIGNELNQYLNIYPGLVVNDCVSALILKIELERTVNGLKNSIKRIIDFCFPKLSRHYEISARAKTYDSIFIKRLFSKNVFAVEDIHDYFGVRIEIKNNDSELCYKVFKVLSSLYKLSPYRYKDFIPMPNEGDYQTLQWTAIVPQVKEIEFQVRTSIMHERSYGGHIDYKKKYFDQANFNSTFGEKIGVSLR